MTKILAFVAVSAFPLLISACDDAGTSSDAAGHRAYQYSAFDTLGNTLARGTLWLQFDRSKVTGTWKLDDNRSGELEGLLRNDTLSLNLNPGFVDNNLFLLGVFTVRTYAGKWEQVGFPGVMAQGSFFALQQ